MIILVMPRRDYVPIGAKPNNWIGNGVGTTCSLVKLSSTVSAISKLLTVLAIACVTQYLAALAANGSPQGVSSMAMQQGGLGLMMTLFLITVPPMAAAVFQGTIGQFMAYNAFGQGQVMQPTRPGGGYAPVPTEPVPNASTAMNDAARSHRPAVG